MVPTKQQISQCCPKLSASKLDEYYPFICQALEMFDINTPARLAAFFAQVGHESADFKYMEEIASGVAYENRKDLGNVKPGDGKRYKGRGAIQLTGRANYKAAGEYFDEDFEGEPELVAQKEHAFNVGGWYWSNKGLNQLADSSNYDTITRRINGGFNGKADRDSRWAKCKTVFGVV